MLLLASTSDQIRLVTSAAVTVDVHATWADLDGSTVTPGRTNTLITTATTTAIVDSPGSGVYRTIKTLVIRNRHATAGLIATVVHRASGPTDAEMLASQLGPNSTMAYDEEEGWVHRCGGDGCDVSVSDEVYTSPTIGVLCSAVLTADVANANATANTALDAALSFPVVAGETYWFNYEVKYTSAATTTGSRWAIYGPPGITAIRTNAEYSLTTTTKTSVEGITAYDTSVTANATSAATGANIARIEGYVGPVTQTGRVYLRFASEVSASAVTAKRGSLVRWMRVL